MSSREPGTGGGPARRQASWDALERKLGRSHVPSLTHTSGRRCRYCDGTVFSRKGPLVCTRESCVEDRTGGDAA